MTLRRELTADECEALGPPEGAWVETIGVSLPHDDSVIPVDPPRDLPYRDPED